LTQSRYALSARTGVSVARGKGNRAGRSPQSQFTIRERNPPPQSIPFLIEFDGSFLAVVFIEESVPRSSAEYEQAIHRPPRDADPVLQLFDRRPWAREISRAAVSSLRQLLYHGKPPRDARARDLRRSKPRDDRVSISNGRRGCRVDGSKSSATFRARNATCTRRGEPHPPSRSAQRGASTPRSKRGVVGEWVSIPMKALTFGQ
jgi:hypothetical protein